MAVFNMAVVKDFFVFLLVLLPMSRGKPVNVNRTIPTDNKNEMKPKKTFNLIEDHVKGLKLERDGHVNKDYHHEAFLGKMVEEGTLLFDNMEGYRRLIDLFHKVDKDGDHLVSKAELTVWIHEKIKEHIDEAKAKNHELFKEVDRDSDGYVTWKEFQKKLKEDNTTNNNPEPELDDLGKRVDEMTEHYGKFRRGDMNLDDRLQETEFLYVLHPEHNPQSIKDLVDDMIENFDRNRDKVLTKSEFIQLPPGEVDSPEDAESDKEYIREREEEFASMDDNGDGVVTQEELTKYLDPTHEQRAISEANYLITMADRDSDGYMSEKEMLMNYKLFTGSSMANYAGYLHDEF